MLDSTPRVPRPACLGDLAALRQYAEPSYYHLRDGKVRGVREPLGRDQDGNGRVQVGERLAELRDAIIPEVFSVFSSPEGWFQGVFKLV